MVLIAAGTPQLYAPPFAIYLFPVHKLIATTFKIDGFRLAFLDRKFPKQIVMFAADCTIGKLHCGGVSSGAVC
jgi:hypothetical protein